jgi:hypothetical protein
MHFLRKGTVFFKGIIQFFQYLRAGRGGGFISYISPLQQYNAPFINGQLTLYRKAKGLKTVPQNLP